MNTRTLLVTLLCLAGFQQSVQARNTGQVTDQLCEISHGLHRMSLAEFGRAITLGKLVSEKGGVLTSEGFYFSGNYSREIRKKQGSSWTSGSFYLDKAFVVVLEPDRSFPQREERLEFYTNKTNDIICRLSEDHSLARVNIEGPPFVHIE